MAVVRKRVGRRVLYYPRVRRPDGSWFPTRKFNDRIEAEAFELKLKQQAKHGILCSRSATQQLSTHWHEWSEECRGEVSEGWKRSQDQMFRDHIEPRLGSLRVQDVRPGDIRALLAGLEDRGLGPQMRLHVYKLLRKLFSDAVEDEILLSNPVKKHLRPRVPKKERCYLSPKESLKLLDTAKNRHLGPAVWLGIAAALRPCEIIALQWSCVDFDKGELLIKASYKKKIRKIEMTTKQKDWARVPMAPILADYLRKLPRRSVFVAPGRTGRHLQYEVLLKGLPRLCDAAGVPRITPHEMRHSATELWIEKGAGTEDIRRLLNHSSADTTLGYIHRSGERLHSIAKLVGR